MRTLVAGIDHAPARSPGFLVFESLSSAAARAGQELAAPSARARRARLDTIQPTSPRELTDLGVATMLNGAERWIATRLPNHKLWTDINRAAQLLRHGGGIEAQCYSQPLTVAEIWLSRCAEPGRVQRRVAALASELLDIGLATLPASCTAAECLPAFELHHRGNANFEALLQIAGTGALLSAIVATLARAIGPRLARLAETPLQPEIQLGVLEVERIRARCSISLRRAGQASALLRAGGAADAPSTIVIDRLLQQLGLDRRRPALAALHNAHVLAGLAAAASAADAEAVCFVAEARRHAARWGGCEPLVTWRRQGDTLHGELELPVDLQSIYDCLRRGAPEPSEGELYRRARDLATQVAAIGLASSLAHLRVILGAASARGGGTVHARRLRIVRQQLGAPANYPA
jgi:hydroxymethylglutaryl-CoA reductase